MSRALRWLLLPWTTLRWLHQSWVVWSMYEHLIAINRPSAKVGPKHYTESVRQLEVDLIEMCAIRKEFPWK